MFGETENVALGNAEPLLAPAFSDGGMVSALPALSERKRSLRIQARATRSRMRADARAAALRLVAHFPVALARPPIRVVSGFRPFGGEIDVLPLLAALRRRGCEIVLPVVTGSADPLTFRRWQPGDTLEPGPMGILQPAPVAPRRVPDLLLVPLLAVDRRGRRVGYGGGFYDRTLAHLRRHARPVAVGVAYDCQRVTRVPTDAHDIPVDWIVTDRTCIGTAS